MSEWPLLAQRATHLPSPYHRQRIHCVRANGPNDTRCDSILGGTEPIAHRSHRRRGTHRTRRREPASPASPHEVFGVSAPSSGKGRSRGVYHCLPQRSVREMWCQDWTIRALGCTGLHTAKRSAAVKIAYGIQL